MLDLKDQFRVVGISLRRGTLTLTVPNPHQGDIGVNLLREILRQASIDRDVWETL